jgi:limonene-1,2-epoxide hydrolase
MSGSRSPEELTLELFRRYGESLEGTVSAIEEFFAPDCVWSNSGAQPPTVGPGEAVKMMRDLYEAVGLWATGIEVTHMTADGGRVFTERLDWGIRDDGTPLQDKLPIAGVLEWEGETLLRWAEYFDPTPFIDLLPGGYQTGHEA